MTLLSTRLTYAAATAAVTAVLAFGAPAQATTLKWITFKPEASNDAQSLSTKWFVEEFKKRTGGKDEIKMFWGGSVAKSKEIPDALSGGAGDIGDIIAPYFQDKFPLNNAVGYFIPQPHSTIEVGELIGRLEEANIDEKGNPFQPSQEGGPRQLEAGGL